MKDIGPRLRLRGRGSVKVNRTVLQKTVSLSSYPYMFVVEGREQLVYSALSAPINATFFLRDNYSLVAPASRHLNCPYFFSFFLSGCAVLLCCIYAHTDNRVPVLALASHPGQYILVDNRRMIKTIDISCRLNRLWNVSMDRWYGRRLWVWKLGSTCSLLLFFRLNSR